MTTGALIIFEAFIGLVIVFGIYAANHLEDDNHTDISKNKNGANHQ